MEKFVDGVNFQDVPEECIAAVFGFTTPMDLCRLAVVSKDFRSASESNIVWERLLPSDCEAILSRSERGGELLADLRSKKQLYMSLANRPLLVDGATKSFWLEKSSGKKCWMLSARSLSITWSSTPRYWQWTSMPESRFPEVAELICVCWLEIIGTTEASMLSPEIRYAAYLVFKLREEAYGFDRFGAETSVQSSAGKTEARAFLKADSEHFRSNMARIPRGTRGMYTIERSSMHEPLPPGGSRLAGGQNPNQRTDGWQEVLIGEFFTHAGEKGEIKFSLMEVKEGWWMSGLIVDGIEIRPVPASIEE